MNLVLKFQLLLVLLFALSCTGQKPAPIRHSTSAKAPIKASCSDLKLEGQVLSKKNIINIFDCTGWAKTYPALFEKIKTTDESKVDHVFEVFNQKLFMTKEDRKKSFQFIIESEDKEYLDSISYLIEKALYDHHFLGQLDLVLNSNKISDSERSSFMKILSNDPATNSKNLRSFQKLSKVFEKYKGDFKRVLEVESDEEFRLRMVTFLDDIASSLDQKNWSQLSQIVYKDKESIIKSWASEGLDQDINNLLSVIKENNFEKDVSLLNDKIKNGLFCENLANEKSFSVNIGQELKHKIESLKNDSYEKFERTLIHGVTKFVAFKDFCQEEKYKQGLDSFSRVLDYCFRVIPSNHDYKFLQELHKVFGEDRFTLLGFLSSDSFSTLRDLFIKLEDKDQDFVRILYQVLSEVPDEDLKNLASLLFEASLSDAQTQKWYLAWSKIWNTLEPKDKIDFINLLSLISDTKFNSSLAAGFVSDLFEEFPALSSGLAFNLSQSHYQNDLRYLIAELSQQEIQKDLTRFLSDKGLFEFLKILAYSPDSKPSKLSKPTPDIVARSYVSNPLIIKETKTRVCYQELTDKYKEDSSYYSLVVELPEICRNVLGEVGFVGQIYLWMNNSHRYFNERYGVNDFHGGEGVWAPGMLHFIFSAAINADKNLIDSQGSRGLKNNLSKIYKDLTQKDILETFHLVSKIYVNSSEIVPFEAPLQTYFSKISDVERIKLFNSFFRLIENDKAVYEVNAKPSSCKNISNNLGADPCLEEKIISDKIIEILSIAKRKYPQTPSLIEELINWVHPKAGISLPFRFDPTRKHSTSIEEIIKFVYDLSAETTVKEFTYFGNGSSKEVNGDTLSRLEVVIRDISFNNNFYGAYFKNEVAAAINYHPEVSSSEKLLKWLGRASGPLRGIGGMDKDSKWRLKNVKETFSSLVEISDEYPQADGSVRSYNEFIQSLLAAIARSSKIETQNFNAYRLPKDELTEGHNGIFLTKIVELSGLRRMSTFVRSRMGDLSSLNSPEFKKINSALIGRHDSAVLQRGIQRILDSYLNADRNQLNILISDAVHFISGLTTQEQKLLEESILKLLILLSDEKISTKNIQKVAEGLEVAIKMWPEIREILLKVDNKEEVLRLVNRLMDSLVANPLEVETIIQMILESDVLSVKDMESLLKNSEFRINITEFINHTSAMKINHSELNWTTTLKEIFGNKNIRYAPLVKWLETSMKTKPQGKLSVSVLISFLGEKDGENYRLKSILDEFFINHSDELLQFVSETFPALEIKN